MEIAEFAQPEPFFTAIKDFDGLFSISSPKKRLDSVRKGGNAFRERMLKGKAVPYFRSFDLIRVPYPTGYAFSNVCLSWSPYVHILNRLFIVQFNTPQGLKTMLVSPTDIGASRETPYFKRLAGRSGPLRPYTEQIIAPKYNTVETVLESVGLSPEDIDNITFDHMHTQNVTKWLGSHGKPGYLPNAKLLIMKQEWESTTGLIPINADWYCPGGVDGVPLDKVILLDGSTMLGEGVALIATPGHTEGNHSIVVHTDEGLMVTSENGVGPDAYAPLHSAIPGLSAYAHATNSEVILNGNTLEQGLNQYVSMVLEKTIAGPSVRNSNFPNMVNSSELSYYWLFPVNPSFSFGPVQFGKLTLNEKKDF